MHPQATQNTILLYKRSFRRADRHDATLQPALWARSRRHADKISTRNRTESQSRAWSGLDVQLGSAFIAVLFAWRFRRQRPLPAEAARAARLLTATRWTSPSPSPSRESRESRDPNHWSIEQVNKTSKMQRQRWLIGKISSKRCYKYNVYLMNQVNLHLKKDNISSSP